MKSMVGIKGRLLLVLTLGMGIGGAANEEKGPATDLHGDPLPPGALLRFGTVRLRHNETIQGVAFSPDGKTFASVANGDEAIRLWDAKTGKAVREFILPRRELTTGVAFSPDGSKLATGGREFGGSKGYVRLWEVRTGKKLFEITVRNEDYTVGIAFSPDSNTLATGGKNTRIWNAATGAEILDFQPPEESNGVAFSPDGKLLAATHEKKITVWHLNTGAMRLVIPKAGDQGHVLSAVFTDNTTLASSGSGQVHFWEVTTGKKLRDFKTAKNAKCEGNLAVSADRKLLAGAFRDRIVIWNIATGETICLLSDYYDNYSRQCRQHLLAFSPDGKSLAAIEMNNVVRLWDITTGKRVLDFADAHSNRIGSAAFSPDGRQVLTCGWEGTVRLWDAGTAKQLHLFLPEKKEKDAIQSGESVAVFSPDGKMVAAGGDEFTEKNGFAGSCRIWDAATGKELHFQRLQHRVGRLGFAQDGKSLAIATWEVETGKGRIYVLDFSTEKKVIMDGEGVDLRGLAFAFNGKTLATVDPSMLRLWNVATKKQRAEFVLPDHIASAAFSGDGKLLAISNFRDDMLWVLEVATGKSLRSIKVENTKESTLAFSPDGRILASCQLSFSDAKLDEYDVSIHFWEIITGQEVFQINPPPATVHTLAFSPDGRALVSGLINGTALTWNVKPIPTKPPSPQDLGSSWKSLGGEDAAKAYAAISTFEAVPETSLPFLKDRLLSALAVDAKRVHELIADLGSEKFPARQAAKIELTKLGDKATGYLRQALADNPSLEVRRRVESLLAAARNIQPGEDLRRRRAIQVLEDIGSQRAREILEILAKVSPTTGEAEDAQMTLERMRKKPKKAVTKPFADLDHRGVR